MTFSRILCGVDFSPASEKAFEAAVHLARSLKAELHLMHVLEAYPTAPQWLPLGGMDELTLAMELKAKEAMDDLVARNTKALQGVPLTTEIIPGRAFHEITKRARERGFDLVVLGSRGIKLLDEPFVGSTTERVLKAGGSSVLVVRS